MQTIQKQATQVLQEIRAGKHLDQALQFAKRQPEALRLSIHQQASIQDIVYGVMRFDQQIQKILGRLLVRSVPTPPLDELLRVAIYQLLWTNVAPHAVVDQAVALVKQWVHQGLGSLVNGVLRQLLRQKTELYVWSQTTFEGKYNHPKWWVEQMQVQYPENWAEILEQNLQHPPMTLRIDLRKNSVLDYQNHLKQINIQSHPVGLGGLILTYPLSVNKLPGFEQGWFSVQDLSAQWAAQLLSPQPGQRVLDACAAPGGKTTHLAEFCSDLDLWAVDIHPVRLIKLQQTLRRTQTQAHVQQGDLLDLGQWWDGRPFDRILLDAPCSGSGVVRRHPDIKYHRKFEDLPRLSRQQSILLMKAWSMLSVKGRLLYATCSVFAQENKDVIDKFLEKTPEAQRISWSEPLSKQGQLLPTPEQDGFYYALLEKIS
ncbi:MAG: 16S rRNA (cytosine(967)-C(5))-methyltransferase RsmB [Ferrovum sp.]|nr:16S rRNA (cytosine(967)-C(5))-methyltransferase RsmB [Ferrovum sp.]